MILRLPLIEAWADIKSFKPKADRAASPHNGPDGGKDGGPPAPGPRLTDSLPPGRNFLS